VRVLRPLHASGIAGGIGTLSRGLTQALPGAVARRHELITPGGRETAIGSVRGALTRLAFEQVAVARAARHADLVHLPDHRPVLATRTPMLATVHDVTFAENPQWFTPAARRYKLAMLRAMEHRHPLAIACVSSWSRDRLLAVAPSLASADVRVVHPGVDRPATSVPGADPGVDRPYFLTVASLEPRKNHLGFLDAFLAARANGLRDRWVVVGADGTLGESIRAVLARAPGVDLRGAVAPDRLDALYRRATAVVLPSHAEGFGFPVLEAMLRDAPVICSTGSGLDESAGDAAVRVGAGDTRGWCEALLAVSSDAELRGRLAGAGRRQTSLFTWERCATAYAGWYDTIARDLAR